MKFSTMVSALAILASVAVTSDLQAQQSGAVQNGSEVPAQRSVGFSIRERQIVAEFFATHRQEAEVLPQGIARELARGKRLPPGITKKPIPSGLETQFPTRPGFEVTIFGDRVVLLEASGVVVDILEGIFV